MSAEDSVIRTADIKRAMQNRYDGFGESVAKTVATIQKPDELWRIAEGTKPALAYFRRRKLETALQLGCFRPGASLLDVGCATGDYTFLLAKRGFQMTGADLSPKSIEAARKKADILSLRTMRFVTTDAENLDGLPDAAFDGVISFSALRYVPNLDKAFEAIWRVLKPGAAAVLDFPNRYCPWFKLLKNRVGVETHIHDHHYSRNDITHYFTATGFTAVEIQQILFTSYLTPTPMLPLFQAVDVVAERMPLLKHTAAILMTKGIKP